MGGREGGWKGDWVAGQQALASVSTTRGSVLKHTHTHNGLGFWLARGILADPHPESRIRPGLERSLGLGFILLQVPQASDVDPRACWNPDL